MNNPDGCEDKTEHICDEHIRYDGGRVIHRNGIRIWFETYYCGICGKRIEVKEEVLD